MVSSNREGQDTPELLQDSQESISVPQNTEVQFNSADIGKKEEPEYFERVKEKSSVKAKKQVDEAAKKTSSFFGKIFKSIGTFFANFGKLITKNKTTKIITAAIVLIVSAALIVYLLFLTIWRPAPVEETIADDTNAIAAWNVQLDNINFQANQKEDDEVMDYYNNLIKDEADAYKKIDLYMSYANQLTGRGFTGQARTLINTLDLDEMTCAQEGEYYRTLMAINQQERDYEKAEEYREMVINKSYQCAEEGWDVR